MTSSYKILDDRLYTETHEWVKLYDDYALVGITDYAQTLLHEIVFIDLPEINREVKKGQVIAEIESVKSVAEVYSPISGIILDINDRLLEDPGLLNKSPYEDGWIVKIKPKNWEEESTELLKPNEYRELITKEES